jgi:putative membrane protein
MMYLSQRIQPVHGVSLVLALHLVGVVGLLSPLANWFLLLTPLNLLLTAGAMVTFSGLDRRTLALALWLGALGYCVEVLGVWTGRVFGEYAYGDILGSKVLEVPLLIGLNWSVLVFAIGDPISRLRLPVALKILASSLAMVMLDVLMEPVAVRLGFWSWEQGSIPFQNYLAWGIVSLIFFSLFFLLPVQRQNPLARWVLLAQVAFFALLNLLLPGI